MNNRFYRQKIAGFTLIELMIAVVIVGVLAAIAIPTYIRYIRKSKTSEAVTNLAGIAQFEEAYFAENDQYLSCAASPSSIPQDTKLVFDSTLTGWPSLGRVIPNQPVYYQYHVHAGSPGNLTGASASVGTSITYDHSQCTTDPSGGAKLGDYVDTSLNPHWFVTYALGDLDADKECSYFVTAVDRNSVFSRNRIE